MKVFAAMDVPTLLSQILNASSDIIKAVQQNTPLPPFGLLRSARLPFTAAIKQQLNIPVLFITDRRDHALTIRNEFSFWDTKSPIFLFPEPTPLFYEKASWGESIRLERMRVLTAFAFNQWENPPIVIAPTRALMTRTIPRIEFIDASFTLSVGQRIPLEKLSRQLFLLGYARSNIVVSQGQFAKRGGLIDFWPPYSSTPYRIDFFGEEIESIRQFDPETQRSIKATENLKENSLTITPAKEFLLTGDIGALSAEPASEFQIPLIHPDATCLLDYLPENSLVVFDDFQEFSDTFQEIDEQSQYLRQEEISKDELSSDFPLPYQPYNAILDQLTRFRVLDLGYTLSGDISPDGNFSHQKQTLVQNFTNLFSPGPRFGGQIKQLLPYIKGSMQKGEQFTIVTHQATRIKELWKAFIYESDLSTPEIIDASLTEGWIFSPPNNLPIHLLTDSEMFGWRRPLPRRKRRQIAVPPEENYKDFKVNEFVVHIDHGIGRFLGLSGLFV